VTRSQFSLFLFYPPHTRDHANEFHILRCMSVPALLVGSLSRAPEEEGADFVKRSVKCLFSFLFSFIASWESSLHSHDRSMGSVGEENEYLLHRWMTTTVTTIMIMLRTKVDKTFSLAFDELFFFCSLAAIFFISLLLAPCTHFSSEVRPRQTYEYILLFWLSRNVGLCSQWQISFFTILPP